jgi:Fe-S oxidoreductase
VDVCPSAGAGEPFTPRNFIAWAREELLPDAHPLNKIEKFKTRMEQKWAENEKFESAKIWHCTTCRACLEICPVYVATPDAIRGARSKVVEEGTEMPDLLARSLKNVYKYHNPWEATKKKRAKWGSDLDIPNLIKEEDGNRLCYFVGCTTSMELRAQALARSFVNILNHAEIPFGTLGKKEPCCGDIARRAGEDGLFEMKMEDCSDLFQDCGIQDVVTSSPHCFHTFKNEYPAYMELRESDEQVSFRVRHYTEVLAELLKNGSLKFGNSLGLKVTYHDPCYLGRYNRIFDSPRDVIRAIPGVELLEMEHHREHSLCCGGGGDRMWQEEMDPDPKMSEIRMQEAAATGADVVITACPLCLIMLEDARKTSGLEEKLRVMDLNELVAMALGLK